MPERAISSCTPTSCSIRKRGLTIASEATETRASGGLFALLRTYFQPHLSWFVGGTLFAFLTSVAATSYGLLIKYVGDGLQLTVQAGDETSETEAVQSVPSFPIGGIDGWIGWAAAGIVLAACLRALSLYLMTLLNNTGVQRALVDIQNAQYASLMTGDFARLSGSSSGSFVSRFINDVNVLRDAGLRLANNLTKGVVTVLGAFAGMLYMDWQLTLILLVAYPIAFGPVISLGNRIRKRSKQAQSQVGEVTALLSEGLQGGRLVKAYQLEDYQIDRARLGFTERARLYLKVLRDRAAVDPILEVAGGVAIAGVLGFTAWRIVSGAATIGDLLGFIALIGVAAPELRALGTLNAVAQEGGAAADRVHEILEAPTSIEDAETAEALQDVQGAIAFRDVHFAYPDGSQALNGLDLTVQPGETVALVGPSGSGKSTVLNLLLRLFDVGSGSVEIDGKDVRHVTQVSLRQQMALVSQDATLFDDTVAANIALGDPSASDEQIVDAAKAANAHDFIMALPDGYETRVGEGGGTLSGGQRQRLSIARAILRDAPILLLDEATSALDTESEAHVQAALEKLSEGRTTLIIAHRLSTIRSADRIHVFESGRIAETGTHQSLMDASGLYARLNATQES